MEKVLPNITDDERETLRRAGLKSYTPKPLNPLFVPHSGPCIYLFIY